MNGFPNNHCELYWHSLDDDLPPIREKVLIISGSGRVNIGILKGHEDLGYTFWHPFLECTWLYLGFITVAWMPMPTGVLDE